MERRAIAGHSPLEPKQGDPREGAYEQAGSIEAEATVGWGAP